MIKSDKPTGLRLVKAYCGDEYSDCPAAIVKISSTDVEQWAQWDIAVKELEKQHKALFGVEFWGPAIEFVSELGDSGDEEYEWEDILDKEGDIWITDVQLDDYNGVDDTITGIIAVLNGNGYISFKGTGKHSGTEYWTDSLKIEEL